MVFRVVEEEGRERVGGVVGTAKLSICGIVRNGHSGKSTIVSECLSGLYVDAVVAHAEGCVRFCEGVAGWKLGEDGAEKVG